MPRRGSEPMVRALRADRLEAWKLREIVDDNFELPVADEAAAPAPRAGLTDHIARLWPRLVRETPADSGSAIALPRPYVVPGGRFRELYYWDSYFTMLGLARDGRQDLIDGMVENFTALIERFGHVPNGARSYYLSRSQPPVYYLMVALSAHRDDPRTLAAMRREHGFWMRGGRVVTMPDGATLNRYWDDRAAPRDESWAEDVATAQASQRDDAEVWRDLRAGAESGWDYSSRWLADPSDLSSIRTTRLAPVCLNALLFGLESTIAARSGLAADAEAAERRRAAITRWLWSPDGRFGDWDLDAVALVPGVTAATLYPLFTGVASATQAAQVAETIRAVLLAPGGVRTTTAHSGQQWDAPNGWAPLQWIAVAGLEGYGKSALARDIAERWIATVTREYRASGWLIEKYDIEDGGSGGGGEYPAQDGFGWTNGVTRELIARYGEAA